MLMSDPMPTILALDFDGVVCDGLVEYFQAAWLAYCRIWTPADATPLPGLNERFYRLRPVVETGWEMPLVLRSLLSGVPDNAILENWGAIAKTQLEIDQVTPAELGSAVDGVRDEWIAAEPDQWLAQHRFYPGVIERLHQVLSSPVHPLIITTKEGRFVHQLLQQQGIKLVDSQVFGKETKRPKADTLRALLAQYAADTGQVAQIWFVEDRLKTLQTIRDQPDLQDVQLFLADWGYNTERDRQLAQHDDRIHLLPLKTFGQEFQSWL